MPDDLLFVESVTAAGHRLRVDFFKLSDRYGHRLSVVLRDEAGRETTIQLAESVEGTSDDPWPPSPPLQSLSIEQLANGHTAALLVGMAGRCHWSASIAETADGAIDFDYACRGIPPRRIIGCRYRAAEGIAMGPRSTGGIRFLHLNRPLEWCLVPFSAGDEPACEGFAGSGPGFELGIAVSPIDSTATYRWRYRLAQS